MIKAPTARKTRRKKKFSFKKYFKTSEGIEFLKIFKSIKKTNNLSKAEIMAKAMVEFKNRYPSNSVLDKMLAEVS